MHKGEDGRGIGQGFMGTIGSVLQVVGLVEVTETGMDNPVLVVLSETKIGITGDSPE
jgi:hypothetical protein